MNRIADDVFHLRHVEVEDALADVMLAWASGGTELGARHWQPIVAERKLRQIQLFS